MSHTGIVHHLWSCFQCPDAPVNMIVKFYLGKPVLADKLVCGDCKVGLRVNNRVSRFQFSFSLVCGSPLS